MAIQPNDGSAYLPRTRGWLRPSATSARWRMMMWLILLFMPCIVAHAQFPSFAKVAGHPQAATRAATPLAFDWHARGLLFRVSTPPGTIPEADNLIFGTIHFGDAAALHVDQAALQRAVDSMHTLVTEVDNTAPWESRYDHYRFLANGSSLPMLIGAADFERLDTLLAAQKPYALSRYKPWVAMTLLESWGDVPPSRTLDRVIEDMAREHGMRMLHLETIEDQLAALDCVPPKTYAIVLKERLAHPEITRADTLRALRHYQNRNLAAWLADIDAMRGLDARARPIEQRARECLIEQRNARWMEELRPLLLKGGCFIAVGAIHLTGPHGLLAQLSRSGFVVTRVPL